MQHMVEGPWLPVAYAGSSQNHVSTTLFHGVSQANVGLFSMFESISSSLTV